jgi:hypothetical protein
MARFQRRRCIDVRAEGNLYIRPTLKEHAYIVDPEYSPKAGRLVRATGATVLLFALFSVVIPLPAFAQANWKLQTHY